MDVDAPAGVQRAGVLPSGRRDARGADNRPAAQGADHRHIGDGLRVIPLFGQRFTDILSGYRVFSRRFVKTFPALAAGFETETEFTVHALQLHMPVAEMAVTYRERPPGSVSKLRTVSDGWRILGTIVLLVKEGRPAAFFGLAGAMFLAVAVLLGLPLVGTFLQTGLVPRLPTAVLATGLALLGFLSFVCGLILDSVARGRLEIKRLAYLQFPGPPP